MENTPENLDVKISLSFRKEERLCSKKIIDKLFTEGTSFLAFPIKVQFLETTLPVHYPVQAGFTVSKKIFKKAVLRNLLKRRMREAFRLNKHNLYSVLGEKQMAVFFIFIGKEISEFDQIEAAMKKALKKLPKKNPKENEKSS